MHRPSLTPLYRWLLQKLSQLPNLDQLLKIIAQSSTILCSVSTVLMILAIKTLIMLGKVSSHLIRPLEIRFILYLVKDLVYGLPKYCINYLSSRVPSMSRIISPRSVVIIPLQPKASSVRRGHLRFPLPLLLIFLEPFILVNSIH